MTALIGTVTSDFPVMLPRFAAVTREMPAHVGVCAPHGINGYRVIGGVYPASRKARNPRMLAVSEARVGMSMRLPAVAPTLIAASAAMLIVGVFDRFSLPSQRDRAGGAQSKYAGAGDGHLVTRVFGDQADRGADHRGYWGTCTPALGPGGGRNGRLGGHWDRYAGQPPARSPDAIHSDGASSGLQSGVSDSDGDDVPTEMDRQACRLGGVVQWR